jgi:hypothetical protein
MTGEFKEAGRTAGVEEDDEVDAKRTGGSLSALRFQSPASGPGFVERFSAYARGAMT